MAYAISSLDELGEGYGFRKIRAALGVTAFGANALVMPPGLRGVPPLPRHAGRALLRPPGHGAVRGRRRGARPRAGLLVHVESTTPRKFSNAGDDDLVVSSSAGRTATSSATAISSTPTTTWSGARRSARLRARRWGSP